MSRRAILARVPLVLAAANGLAACGSAPELKSPAGPSLRSGSDLGHLVDGASEVTVAGEPLNTGLLQKFYELRGFKPVWTTRQTRANSLVNAVMRAGDHGMAPELFHADLLRRIESLPPSGRELVLSSAFLSYADALARGAVPVERRKPHEALTPGPLDVAATLDAAIDNPDPAVAIEALAPATPSYQALRQAWLRQRASSRIRNAAAMTLLRKIEVNLERQRWLPRPLPPDRVWVNVPDQQLVLYRGNRPIFSTRVVVGEAFERSQSPEFGALIEASFFNPPWVIPSDIASAEYLPRLVSDPDYLTRNNMVLRPNGEIEQAPGPEAGLGLIMFDMPNRFDVYLHDTPNRRAFIRGNRRISHGCIRVQNPTELAALLMERPIDAIHEGIAMGGTTRHMLPRPIPVFVIYQTAFADTDDKLQFRPDFYGRDSDLWRELQPRANGQDLQAPAAGEAPDRGA